MRPTLLALTITMILSAPAYAQDTFVNGYTREDGTYVQPHHRSQTDGIADNNFSTRGNINPYTATIGTVQPPRGQSENDFNHFIPSTNPSREWNNDRPYGSSYRRPQGRM